MLIDIYTVKKQLSTPLPWISNSGYRKNYYINWNPREMEVTTRVAISFITTVMFSQERK